MAETTAKKTGGRPKKTVAATETTEKKEFTAPAAEVEEKPAKEQKTTVPVTFTAEQVKQMVDEAVAAALANVKQESAANDRDKVVTVLFVAEVSKDNVLEIPGYGTLRQNAYLEVPKREFGGKFMSALVRKLIDRRELLVVDGLTADERVRWNCDYKEGEVLTERVFDHLLDYDIKTLCDVFSRLCKEHQQFVCRRFITAKENKDNRVNIDKVKALNEISKKNDQNGMLHTVIDEFRKEI